MLWWHFFVFRFRVDSWVSYSYPHVTLGHQVLHACLDLGPASTMEAKLSVFHFYNTLWFSSRSFYADAGSALDTQQSHGFDGGLPDDEYTLQGQVTELPDGLPSDLVSYIQAFEQVCTSYRPTTVIRFSCVHFFPLLLLELRAHMHVNSVLSGQ